MNGWLQLTKDMGIRLPRLIAEHVPRRDCLPQHPRNHLSLPIAHNTHRENASHPDRNIARIIDRYQRHAEGPSH